MRIWKQTQKVGNWHVRDRSQTLIRGAWCKEYLLQKFFGPPPSDRKKVSGPPFLPWKLQVNPIEKHVNSIFNGKSVVIFSGPPLQGSEILRTPFLHQAPPLTSVCEWSLMKIFHYTYNSSGKVSLSFIMLCD